MIEFFAALALLMLLYVVATTIDEALDRRNALKALETQPFPDAYRAHLETFWHYRLLDSAEKERLHRLILRFLFLKTFIAKEMVLSSEIKLSIAFFACFMVLKLGDDYYAPLRYVIVYPHALEIENRHAILEGFNLGERIVIAWNSAKKGMTKQRRANVVIHEFAHEIDFADGSFDGIPPLSTTHYRPFAHTMHRTFNKLTKTIEKGRFYGDFKLLGSYAATNEAEFFAVASELYFEQPVKLHQKFPAVYNVLEHFYGMEMLRRLST